MKSKFIDAQTDYDGSQLKPLYSYVNHKFSGDSIVSFAGKCDVTLDHMVDAEDFVVNAEIRSDKMLHFIVEVFQSNLLAAVSLQRLLVAIAQNIINKSGVALERNGDDLYFNKKKLSVSIASVSQVSFMIHLGFNIENTGTPVPTCCLKDFGLDYKQFAVQLMNEFCEEFNTIVEATQKVKPL